MKTITKLLILMAAITILTALLALSISAGRLYTGNCGVDGDNVTYKLDTATGLLEISGTGAMKEYESYKNVPWNSYINYIKSLKISDGVTSIGSWMFSDCCNLKSVIIPDSVEGIGSCAFRGCSGLASIELPNRVTKIGNGAFNSCSSLSNIKIPNSVTNIGADVFASCYSLTNIEIPDSVTSIGGYAFYECVNLANVTISNNINSIGDNTFYRCNSLTSIVIPNGVERIGDEAFARCSNLTSVIIPNSVTSIGARAFHYCSNLTSAPLPESIKGIGEGAFVGCSLISVTIPKSLMKIGDQAFLLCSSLKEIKVDENNEYYCDVEGVLLTKNKKTLIQYPIGNEAISYSVPDSVTRIGFRSFYGCESLLNIKIPDSVTIIDNSVFQNCSSLTSIEIPNSVTSIGFNAFYGCSSLESIKFETKNALIDTSAFYGCENLKTIYLYKNSTADEFFSSDKYTKIYLDADFMTFEGYQVRDVDYNGLRSLFKVDFNAMPTLERDGFEVIELGAIFVSADKLAAMGDEFVVSKGGDGTYKTVSYGMTIPVMKNGTLVGNYVSKTEDELVFACTITNFDATNYNKLVSSRGYAVLADADGNEYVVYCDYEVEEYRSVSLEMICDALYSEGQITADNISYQNVVAFRKED